MATGIVTDSGASSIDGVSSFTVVPFWLQELKEGDDKKRSEEPEWQALDTPDIGSDDFAKFITLNAAGKLKTAQPNPRLWAVGFREALLNNDSAIGLAMHIGISKSVESAREAAKDVAKETGQRVDVVDCQSTSMIQAMIALKASEIATKGATFEDVKDAIELLTRHTYVAQVFSDIHHLYNGGRLGYLSYLAATTFNVLPIVSFVDYQGTDKEKIGQLELDVVRKVRRWDGVIPATVEHIKKVVGDLPIWIGYVHNGVQDHLAQLVKEVNQAGFNVVRESLFTQQNLVLNVYSGDQESIGIGAVVMPPELC